jgi:hypothetical protein
VISEYHRPTMNVADRDHRGGAAGGGTDGVVMSVATSVSSSSSVEVGTAQLLRIRQLELECRPASGPAFDDVRWERGLRAVLGDRIVDALKLRGDHIPDRLVMKRSR